MTRARMSSYTRIIHLQCEFVALQRWLNGEGGEAWQDNKVAYELRNCFITERVLTENKGAHYKLHCYTRNLAAEAAEGALLQRTRTWQGTWPGRGQEVAIMKRIFAHMPVTWLVYLAPAPADFAFPEWLFNI